MLLDGVNRDDTRSSKNAIPIASLWINFTDILSALWYKVADHFRCQGYKCCILGVFEAPRTGDR